MCRIGPTFLDLLIIILVTKSVKQDVLDELQGLKLRATVPRVKILEIFYSERRRKTARARSADGRSEPVHFSVDDMFKRLIEQNTDVGLATVYRVMQQFEEAGLLSSSRFDADRVVYELNEGRPHDHIVCMMCGRVDEFYDTAMVARQKAVAEGLGYMLHNHQLALYGICSACQAKTGKPAKGKRSSA